MLRLRVLPTAQSPPHMIYTCSGSQETALLAVQRFAGYMAEVGVDLSEAGIKLLAMRVEDELMKVAIARSQL